MTSREICALLEVKHARDFFLTEVKSGPTQGANHFRLDAWAMRKSWAHPLTAGYEIKVSRRDFMGDNKWHVYLKYCNCLYFVCPYKMIVPEEVPEGLGLMWVSRTGTRLFTKRKAPYRDVDIPEEMYRYILMSRVRAVPSYYDPSTTEDWGRWLARKDEKSNVGRQVAHTIRRLVGKRIEQVETRNRDLEYQIKDLREILEWCEHNKVRWRDYYHWRQDLQKLKDNTLKIVDEQVEGSLRKVHNELGALLDRVKQMKQEKRRCGREEIDF